MNKNFSAPSKQELVNLYVEKSLPMHEISKRLNISIGSVFNYIKKYNIKTRNHLTSFTFKGKNHSQKSKDILSSKLKGRTFSQETRDRMSIAQTKGGIGHKKKRADGYIAVYFPDHPQSNKDGYIMEHDLIAECLLGRWLAENECVHHKNKIRDDNRKDNLFVMTKSEHMSLHSKERWEEFRNAQ